MLIIKSRQALYTSVYIISRVDFIKTDFNKMTLMSTVPGSLKHI
jgi:hypothetical protein